MKNSYKIGLVFIGSLVLLYLAILWGTQSHVFRSHFLTYYIDFENVNGLKVSDPVLIRGFEVGKVSNIELKNDFCRVEVSIERSYPLKNQTQAEIQIRELLSGKQLVLFPHGNEDLPNGSILKGSQTFDFSYALSKIGKFIQWAENQNIDYQKFNFWVLKVDSLFQNSDFLKIPNQISRVLNHFEQVMGQVQQKQLISKLDSVTAQLHILLNHLDITQKNFDDLLVSSKPLIHKTDTTFIQLDSVLVQSQKLLFKLNETMEKIQNQSTTLNALIYKEEFYQDIQKTLENLNKTLDHVREKRIRVIAKMWGKE